MRPVLRKLARLVQDGGVTCASPLVRFSNDNTARHQECEVMKTRLAA